MPRTGIEADKQRIREQVWTRLQDARAALFPGARGRIPNFTGAAQAADLSRGNLRRPPGAGDAARRAGSPGLGF